jgi:ATP-dependent exoDNAse (exonuclease V) alpha subunit
MVRSATLAGTLSSAAMKRLEAGTLVWSRKDVLIVDEAAMLATQHLAGVVGRAREAGAKVMTFLDGVEQRRWADKPGGTCQRL